ncbi:hypothetical protein BN134_1931 [Cronobacter dublinensis 1210]|uniref:Uncharacterized protein n=1 Tax=Cronobacter dublinensis 1210 TaxID=1208656 RepID=A0ABP1W6N9_9ENTR|nr:hypothetical protein BN134_1931 [Cronobacter dublinensis 1210]
MAEIFYFRKVAPSGHRLLRYLFLLPAYSLYLNSNNNSHLIIKCV